MTPPSRRLRDRITPADGWYVLVLAILPALINLPWAFAGRPLMGGDNLSQNYPLRVLVGQFLAHGQLPLWNPDIWSGAPLLAGWNAGAMYPGTWLFAVLPGIAAWELNLIFTAAMAGIGMHVFLRTQRCTPLASFLGGLVFTYTGFMSGQAVHLGLYEGMSFAPFILVAIELMSRRDRLKDMGGPIALLAVSAGLAVLSGDPRAPSNCAVAAAVFLLARLWRSRSKAPRLLAGFVVAILLAALLAAPQWLPGLAFLHVSQRSAGSVGWYSAGSLRISQLSYFVVPFLFGGNHNFGLPGFAGTYNLPELTYGAGIVSLVALVVCSLRLMSRRHRHTSPTGIFVAMFIVGVLLSLGTTTPLGHLLAHVPLFGGERLQNRNSAVADLALSCLLAIFVDSLRPGAVPVAADGAGSRRRRPNMLARGERVVALLPALCAAGLIAAIYLATRAVEGWLQASHFTLSLPEGSTPYYVAVLAIALSVVAVVLWPHFGRRLTQRRLASGLVVADVLLFLMMASYQPAPPGSLAASNSATRALLAAGAASGRMAIFDPQQTPVRDPPFLLDDVGSNDLVILHHLRSVQGYGSIVSNAYEALTGAHEVLNLRPSALRGQTLDALNLRVLVTLPSLFGSVQPGPFTARLPSGPPLPPGSAAIDREPGDVVDFHSYPPSGPWRLSAVQPTVFELAAPVVIDGLSLRVGARANRTVSLRIALESGAVLSLRVHTRAGSAVVGLPEAKIAAGGGVLSMQLTEGPGPAGSTIAEAVAVHLRPGPHTPAFDGPGDRPRWLALNGILQGLLDPPHWRYAGILGPLVLYTNEAPFGSSFLEPLTATGISTARALGSVSEQAATEWQAPSELVDVPEGAWLVRSASYDPGWSASALPVGRSAASASPIHLVVRSFGVLQAVRLPAGVYKVTWRYGSERAEQGLALAAAGTVACMLMLGYEIERLRRRRRRPRRLDREPETCEPRVGRERAGEEERAAFELR